jgi:hypothetical protein
MGPSDVLVFETDFVQASSPQFSKLFLTPSYFALQKPDPTFPADPSCTEYRRYESRFSDHRPVSATFDVTIPKIVPERRKAFEAVREAKLNEMANSFARAVVTAPKKIIVVRGEEAPLELKNTGLAWARWSIRFIVPDDSQDVRCAPIEAVLLPGTTVKIQLTIRKKAKPRTVVIMIMSEERTITAVDIEITKKRVREGLKR